MSDKLPCFQKDESISASISFLRFPLTVMIVMYHCYCVQIPHGQPLYAALIYPFGLMLGETGVPAFFFISGFLFFYSKRKLSQKLRSRITTLFVPYILWNALILLVYVSLMVVGHPLIIGDKSITDFQFIDYIRAFVDRGDWNDGNGQPLLCPYWYVRNLLLLSLAAPILRYTMKLNTGIVVLFALLIWWISIPYNGMLAQSLLFYCMGAFFSINRMNPLKLDTPLQEKLLVSIWIVFVCLDWLMHFWIPMSGALFVHRLVLILNIFVFWRVACYASTIVHTPQIMEKSSFWIYTTHYPLTILIRETRPVLTNWEQMGFYWISVLMIVAICIFTYWIGQRIIPKMMAVLTGNR